MSTDDRARLEALVGALDRIVSAKDAPADLARDKRAALAEAGASGRDLEALASLEDRRLLLYRKLVRRGVAAAVRQQIPRAAARLGALFDEVVTAFVDEDAGPRSHYLRDVAFELVAWASPRWANDARVPAWLVDLARHELSAFEVGCEHRPKQEAGAALDLGARAVFDPSARLYRYAFAVHRLAEELDARDEPAHEPTALFAYRDADDDPRWLELSPFAAAVIERLLAGEPLRDAAIGGASAAAIPLDDAALASLASVLDDLVARGALLGGAT